MELTCASTSSTCFFLSPPSPGAHSSRRRLLSSHSKLAGPCFLWKEISVEKSLKMEHQHHLCITQNITIGPSAAGRGKLRVTLCFSLRHMAHWKRCFFRAGEWAQTRRAGGCRQRRTEPDAMSMHSRFPHGVTKEALVTCLRMSFLYSWLVTLLCERTQKQAGCGNSSATFL